MLLTCSHHAPSLLHPQRSPQLVGSAAASPSAHFLATQVSMSEPDGANDTTPLNLPDFDRASATPSEPGSSAPAVQVLGAQGALWTGVQPEKTVFGVLKQDANYHQQPQNVVFNDDYEQRLPEDPYGEETAPNARIWRVYNEEAAAYDAVFVGQARDGLDVMLIFAGLFSAVVTSFLVQVSQSLQADYTAMSAILLYDLVSVQLSIADGPSSRLNITVPSINPLQTFRPDSIVVWVNGLWVVSLTMSLVVALSAVLVKQWFHHYTSIPSGTPGARSHLRQYRFDGLQKWRVNIIIGILPIIMHTSLALFLTGLMLFFIPLRTSLAFAVGVITVVLCLLYLVSSAMPIFFPQCPYRTPLTDFIFHIRLVVRKGRQSIFELTQPVAHDILSVCRRWILRYLHLHTPKIWFSRVHFEMTEHSCKTLNLSEHITVESDYGKLSVDALDWLFNISSNPTVNSLVIQAIGGLPPDVRQHASTTWQSHNEIRAMRDRLLDPLRDSQPRAIKCDSVRERLIRSSMFYEKWFYDILLLGNFDEPRSMATAWAATYGHFHEPKQDLRMFFCTYHELKLHPFVWERLVSSALTVGGVHRFLQVDSPEDISHADYAHIASLFLGASQGRHQESFRRMLIRRASEGRDQESFRSVPRRISTVTLKEALISHSDDLSASVQRCLLDMLSCFDDDVSATLPPQYRVLHNAAQFALWYFPGELWALWDESGLESCRHLELCMKVLRCLYEEYDIILLRYPSFVAPILELLRAIVDDTSICDCPAAGLPPRSELDHLLEDSLIAIMRLSSKVFPSCPSEWVFPSIPRLLQVLEHYMSEGQSPMTNAGYFTLDLMETTLKTGNEAMYRAFIDGEWLWTLSERYVADAPNWCSSCEPIVAFTRGLEVLGSASLGLEAFDYLQQPRNFFMTFITIASPDGPPNPVALLRLCPKASSSWDTHRTTLDAIIEWCQAADLPFPLDNFFDGKVVQTSRGAMDLDEALREMLANDRYRRKVVWSARTILLGEPAPGWEEWDC